MKTRRRLSIRVAVASLIACALVFGSASSVATGELRKAAKSKGFQPKKVAGEWSGTWTNHTFGSTGPATMSLSTKGKSKKQKFIGVFDLGGNAFGCDDPDPRKVKMTKGSDEDGWSKKGFQAEWANDNGPVHIEFDFKTKRLTGGGVSPCSPEIAYTYEGSMTNSRVEAEVDITLDGQPLAKSSLEMTKG